MVSVSGFSSDNLVFLLGAGASVEAKIPMSKAIVIDLESKINDSQSDWSEFKLLYDYIKSAIIYGKSIHGEYDFEFNVEELLIVLSEIERRDKNLIYPFIGNWNTRLVDLAGSDFKRLSMFKDKINTQLRDWIAPKEGYDSASYYNGFESLHSQLNILLQVFTLNYDLCLERTIGVTSDLRILNGFVEREWNFRNFDTLNSEVDDVDLVHYKMHGSINWYREGDKLCYSDDPVDTPELIFGVTNKITSVDPYNFYTTQFRKALLHTDAKLIIIIGYSYFDEYLNEFIRSALRDNPDLRILDVTFLHDQSLNETHKSTVAKYLKTDPSRIQICTKGASDFMVNDMNEGYLNSLIVEYDEFNNTALGSDIVKFDSLDEKRDPIF